MTCAIILAAGRSRRMGAQKLLLPFGGRTVIGHIVREILRSPIDACVVVAGPDAAGVAETLAGVLVAQPPPAVHAGRGACGTVAPGCSRSFTPEGGGATLMVTNPDSGGEMLSSVRCGLRAAPPDCEAVLVALGDQPTITADLVGRMLDAFRASGRGILVPVHGGKPGHPILFSMRYRDEVLTRYDDVGLRGLRQAHPEDVCELDVPDSAVLTDMDYPEDYRRELARFQRADHNPMAGEGPKDHPDRSEMR